MKKRSKKGYDRSAIIIQLFREVPNKKHSLKHLASCSGSAGRAGMQETRLILAQMIAEGVIEECNRGKYCLSRHHLPCYTGSCKMLGSGALVVVLDETKEEVFVNQHNTRNALDGDRVSITLMRRSRTGTIEGDVVEILHRSPQLYIGTADVSAHQIFVRTTSHHCPTDIYLPRRQYPDLQDGEKVTLRIVEWADRAKCPVGEVVERLGMSGDNDTEMHAILSEFGLPYHFEEEVEEEAARIPAAITEQEIASRRDLRAVPTFTIDPADAKDFDDALSLRRIREGVWEVGVHIADVTHYVRPNSLIDQEAVARGTSVYLVDRTIPMLPERLSNDLCSLRPHEDRLCFSALFTLNEQLDLLDEWFGRTVIHSDRRFTYEEAQTVIECGSGEFSQEILTLHELAQGLRAERFKQGAIAFERDEMRFRMDEQGRPTSIYFKIQQEANQLIEEFMLLANRRVAAFCAHRISEKGRKVPRTMVYRVHDKPTEEKVERFRECALRFGHLFRASKGRAIAKEMTKLLHKIRGSAEENTLSMLAVRSMAKAAYSTDNIGHYGLAFPYYTHFTSPIRRYPDMMVHRLLAHYLEGGRSADKQRLEALCVHSSERELIAAEAERASVKYKMIEFMQGREGECFEGVITGLSEWAIYVELVETRIEGACYLRDFEVGSFRFDPERYEVYEYRSGVSLSLGDRVRVTIRSTDLERRQLRFTLLSHHKLI